MKTNRQVLVEALNSIGRPDAAALLPVMRDFVSQFHSLPHPLDCIAYNALPVEILQCAFFYQHETGGWAFWNAVKEQLEAAGL